MNKEVAILGKRPELVEVYENCRKATDELSGLISNIMEILQMPAPDLSKKTSDMPQPASSDKVRQRIMDLKTLAGVLSRLIEYAENIREVVSEI